MACVSCGSEGKLNVRRPHFYEVYSSTSNSDRLKIPDGFICHMESGTYDSVSLIGPSGNTWPVRLIKQDNDLFFHHGWPKFVGDHRLECGDLLVFRYEGHLHFTVQVFDKSRCEKEAAFYSECGHNPCEFDNIKGHKRDRKENSSLDVVVGDVLNKMKGSAIENQELKLGADGKELTQYEVVKPISMFREKEETFKECSANDVPIPFHMETSNEDEESAILYRSGKEDVLNGVSLLNCSVHDEKKVARSFTSSFPYFVRIMKSFNVSGSYTLNIPYQFSMAHLPNCKIKITLHNWKGECWTVNSVPTTRVHTSHTLCGGWMAFVRGNNIKVGDICIFELVHECELRVQIAGVGTDGLDNQVGKLAFSRPNTGRAITCHKTSTYMPMNTKVSSKCIRKVNLFDKKWSKNGQEAGLSTDMKKSGRASNTSKKMGLSSRSKVTHKKLAVQKRHRVEDELSSQAKAGLRMLFALDEQRVSQAFTSPFPSFVKIMKMFNVSGSYTLKIPYQFSAAHLPTYKTEVTLRNSRGECWTVNSVPDAKGRTVHTFCGGWMAFVRDNDINFGDTCIFELVAQCEMQVYISGVGKEGLDHQNGQVKLNSYIKVQFLVNSDPNLLPRVNFEMAGQSCESCKSWVEDIYWSHFQFFHFTQFLRNGYEQQLALPKTFSDNLKKKLPETVGLRGPCGIVWNIGLTARDDTLYFTDGWQQFLKDHSLKENDFLVFRYNGGESLFDVLIFDGRSFCEKADSYFVRKCGHTELGGGCSSKGKESKDTDNSVGEEGNNTPTNTGVEGAAPERSVQDNSVRVPTAVPFESPSERTFNAGVESATPVQFMHTNGDMVPPAATPVQFMSTNGDMVPPAATPVQFMSTNGGMVPPSAPLQTADKRIRKLVSAVQHVQTKRRGRPPKLSSADQGVVNWVTDSEHTSAGQSGEYIELYTSNRRPITDPEITKTLRLAQAACTDRSLLIVMRPTHIYKRFYLSIPNKWIVDHLSPRSQDLVLRMGKNEWHVKYSFHRARFTGGLTGGWRNFTLDNNLEEFDVCVFEPTGKVNDKMIMDVRIFRVVEDIVPLSKVNAPGKRRGRKKSMVSI